MVAKRTSKPLKRYLLTKGKQNRYSASNKDLKRGLYKWLKCQLVLSKERQHQSNIITENLKKKTGNQNTIIKHNKRDFKKKDWETKYHNHINREREKDNKYLQSTPIREKYDELFGEEVERYNATQKRKDRKIDDYFDKVKNDKTLNTQYEFI